jgi:hypothetical protein
MASLNYFSNFDDEKFKSLQKNEMNKLSDDDCYIKSRNNDNSKKLKFITTNHIDLIENKDKLNFFGYSIKDQLFVPGEKMDTYSNLLNGQHGGQLTNCNVRNGFGQFPQMSNYRGQLFHGNVTIEDNLQKSSDTVKKTACLPKGINFYNRSFNIFDEAQGIDVPNAIKSVEMPSNGFALGRSGMNSRFDKRFIK